MAVVAETNVQMSESFGRRVVWTPLLNGDTGEPVRIPTDSDRTIQLTGTLSVGGELTMEGSLEETPTTWFILNDVAGADIVLTVLDGLTVLENVTWVRPNITGGDGSTSLSVTMITRRTV